MPNAISDSSPLIHLAAIGRLSLIRDYYNTIIIPTAVWREVVEQGGGQKGAMEIINLCIR
jgi:predicted nucleic acid-binding protein